MKVNWATLGVVVVVVAAIAAGVKFGLSAAEVGAFGAVATAVASQLAKLVDKDEEKKP